MKKLILVFFGIVCLTSVTCFASTQTDTISMFQKLDAMLEVGASRMEIQKQLIELKVIINKLLEESPTSQFTQKADSLFEQIKSTFIISDLVPTQKSSTTIAHETIKELLPELKSLASTKKKMK
ncbi:MAG: hypothetical protein AB9872_00290 [Solidesulfovibrio sp.]